MSQNSISSCFIYIRVSTNKQAEKGYSLEAQIDECTRKANDLGLNIKHVFRDGGESGTSIEGRSQFQEMIDRCKEREVSAVIVYHTDRFARNVLDHISIKKDLAICGVSIHSVMQPMSSGTTPTEELMDTIMAGLNEYYSKDLGRKTKLGMKKKFKTGIYPSMAPIGYRNIKIGSEEKSIEPNPSTSHLIAKAFELYATGNYSILNLARTIGDLGLLGRNGKPISRNTLHTILSDTFYYGLMKWDGEEMIGNHKPLITKVLFEQVQQQLELNRNYRVRENKHDFLLRGFITCTIHDRRLVAEWHNIKSKNRDRIGYYHCTCHGGCKGSYIEVDDLETQVSELFKGLEFQQSFIDIVIAEAKTYLETITSSNKSKRRSIDNMISSLEGQREELEDLMIEGTLNKESFRKRNEKIQSQIDGLYEELADIEKLRKVDISLITEILGFTRNINQTYIEAPSQLKRQYIKLFFKNIYVEDRKIIKVEHNPLFETLLEEQQVILSSKWLPSLDSNQD